MISTEYGKYKVQIKKKGIKWLEIEANCKAQVEINTLTRDFEIGNIYSIYAKKKTEKNRYGTTLQFYPVTEAEYKVFKDNENQEKCIKLLEKYGTYSKRHHKTRATIIELAKGNKQRLIELDNVERSLIVKEQLAELENINSAIKRATNFDSNYEYKFNYTVKKLKEIKNLNALTNNYMEEIEESVDKGIVKAVNYLNHLDDIKEKYTALDMLKKNFNYENEELSLSLEKELANNLKNYVDNINLYLDNGFPVEIEYPEIFNKLEDTDKEINKLKEKRGAIDLSKLKDIVTSIFNVETKESFKGKLDILGEKFDEKEFNKYTAYDKKIYILKYRLTTEMFKIAREFCGLINLDYGSYMIKNKYACIDPYLLTFKLIENGDIKGKIESYQSDEEIIELCGNGLRKPYEYKIEEVDDKKWYFVTKELINQYSENRYNAYYLIEWDNKKKKGFCHRLPWADNKYENMSVKDILSETFKENKGYKRVYKDVIIREVEKNTTNYISEEVVRKIEIPEKNKKYERTLSKKTMQEDEYTPYNINNGEQGLLAEGEIEYRKNLFVKGTKVIGAPNLFQSCEVYSNDEIIFKSDTPVLFNTEKVGIKLKYNLYYEDVSYNCNIEIKRKDFTKNEIVYKDDILGEYDGYGEEEGTDVLRNYKIKGIITKRFGDSLIGGLSDKIFVAGGFTIIDGSKRVKPKTDINKTYQVSLGTSHKSSGKSFNN